MVRVGRKKVERVHGEKEIREGSGGERESY